MNKNNSIKRPLKDERDEQIDTRSKSHALEFMIAATQVLTAMCLERQLGAIVSWRCGRLILQI